MFSVSFVFLSAVLFICTGSGEAVLAENIHITIISPKNGEIVDSTFELTYELPTGLTAHNVHIFLDGAYQKGATSSLNNVPSGKHEVKLQVSLDEKDTRIGMDYITVYVK